MSYFNHKLFDVLIENLPATQSQQLADFKIRDDVLGLINQEVDRTGKITFEDVFLKEFFRKVEDAPLGIDTSVVAVSGWMDVEQMNKMTNDNILNMSRIVSEDPSTPFAAYIGRVRRQIRKILGAIPRDLEPRMTIGATADLKRHRNVFNSLVNPSATSACVTYLREQGYIRVDYNSSLLPRSDNPGSPFGSVVDDFTYLPGAKLETVPKTAKTDRVIAKEPTVNIAYQACVGQHISKRLTAFGLDIPTQADVNKELARSSSVSGLLSTVDLSAASDRITRELVKLLLPDEWYSLLDALRSRSINVGGVDHDLEMFSSAGNGFTFELETLIFYSTALCVTQSSGIYNSAPPFVSVFGDDIILPTCYFNNLAQVYNAFGFVINTRKSFSTGLFRESCGGDFYNGINVRGYNAKSLPKTPGEWISITNAVRRVCYYNNGNVWRNRWCSDLWHGLVKHVPETQRLFGPEHYGDTCINCEYTELYTTYSNKWRGEYIKVHAPSGGEFSSAGEQIAIHRVSSELAPRLVEHVSILGHGLSYHKRKDGTYDYESGQKWSKTLLTSSVAISNSNKWIPYTIYGQAEEDLDLLIAGLTSPKAQFLREPRLVVARHIAKTREERKNLILLLGNISSKKAERVRIVATAINSISFEF